MYVTFYSITSVASTKPVGEPHFCTTPDFLPQFEREEREMRELIELGEKAGSAIWVERNMQKLNRLLPVIQVLRGGELHHPAGKAMREYTAEERAKRHAN